MKKISHILFFAIAIYCFSASTIKAQTTFHKTYSTFDPIEAIDPNGIINTSDGGYLFYSYYVSTSNRSGSLIKTDVNGDTVWTRNFVHPSGSMATVITSSIELLNAQGYMLTTYNIDINGPSPSNAQLIRLDGNGNTLWIKEYYEIAGGICWFKSGVMSYDGNILVLGISGNGANFYNIFMKVNTSGNVLWAKKITGNKMLDATHEIVRELADSSIILVGDTLYNNTSVNTTLIKLNSNANLLWAKSYGSSIPYCTPFSAGKGANNTLLITGNRSTFNNTNIGFMMMTDSTGSIMWYKEYGKWSPNYQPVRKAEILGNGNIAAISGVGDTMVLFVTNSTGSVLWSKGYVANSGSNLARFIDFVVANDGGYAIMGQDFSVNFYKTDANGNVGCDTVSVNFTEHAVATLNEYTSNAQITGISITALTPVFLEGQLIIPGTSCITTGIALNSIQNSVEVYPNPFTEKLNVILNNDRESEIKLYDITGRQLLQKEFISSLTLRTDKLKRGIYFYELHDKVGLSTKGKLVKN